MPQVDVAFALTAVIEESTLLHSPASGEFVVSIERAGEQAARLGSGTL